MTLPAWEELAGSPRDGISVDSGPTAERLFLVQWSAKAAFYKAMWDGYRLYPGFANDCYLLEITTEPFSAELCPDLLAKPAPTPADLATYSQNGGKVLLARLRYGFDWTTADWPTNIPKPECDAGTVLALRVRWAGEVMILPPRAVRYEDNSYGDPGGPMPGADDKGTRLFVATPEYQVEWKYVDDPPTDSLRDLLGHTNNAEFLGVPQGCLRFESFELDAGFTLDPDDSFNWTVRCVFKERRIHGDDTITWNHDYRGKPAGWKKVTFSDGTERFPQADFSNMFKQVIPP